MRWVQLIGRREVTMEIPVKDPDIMASGPVDDFLYR